DYAAELFEASTVERLAHHLLALLEQVCAAPQQALGDVQLLDEPGRAQLLGWGQAPAAAAQHLLVEQLNEQARLTPQRTALVWDGGSLDYAGLHQQANRLAHYLRDKGVGPDTCVAIAIERSPQLLVGLLAILKAGGAYVPLDVDYPAERLAYMLADCDARLLLSHSSLLGKLPQVDGVSAIALDQLHLDSWPSHAPGLHLHGDNLAYVIYTSGSTGQPKGVGNTHAALAERLQWMQTTYALNDSDVLMQKAPISFDVSVWECFWPLLTGCKLVLAGPGEHRDPQRIAALVQAYGVTTLHFVPPLLQVFVQEPQAGACSSLRRVFSGGEALSATLRDRVLQVLPQVQLHNRYGPTETAINVTHWHCQMADGARSPIGCPLGNVLCRVLDDELELSAPGVPGELYLGGAGLARGYLGRPGLTAERFVPQADGNGQRLYRSGDRARWQVQLEALEYLGRLDQQVKVRGFRVEPEEVQACLLAQAGVEQALVLIHKDAVGAQLVGYYSGSAQPAEVLAVLAEQLPAYMVPAQLIPLAQMPLGPSGKVDRKALPAPVWQQREHVEPRTELQQQVAGIWRDVLNLPRIGLQDDFFALGGHSLLATQIVSRTRQACDVELPLKALFEASELGAFCAEIARLRAAGERNLQGAIARVDRRQAVPLSYSQQRMWFLWQMEPDSPAYNVGGMARLRGTLHVDAFERALQALIVRHETLRTTFPSIDGVPYQCVAEDSGLHLDWQDFSALSDDACQQRLQQLADDQAHQPFDLERGPLLRACLVKANEREHFFVLTLHHIVTEGWAMDIFARELGELYEAFVDDRESPLAPLPVQYLDYSVWQRQWLESGEGARQLAYWKHRLGDEHPVLALPADRPRPAVQSHRGELYRFELDPALVARVHAFNSQRGLTLFMTMTATLAALLHRYSGQADIRVGIPVANRTRAETERLIGFFVNTQVMRAQVDGGQGFDVLLRQTRQAALQAQAHQDLPFEQLVEALAPERNLSHSPVFQVLFNHQYAARAERNWGDLRVEPLHWDSATAQFDLVLDTSETAQGLMVSLAYDTDLFERSTIERLSTHFINLLQGIVEQPQQPVAELPLLAAAERERTLVTWNATAENYPLEQSIQQLIEAQVQRTPDAPALAFGETRLSYAQLNARANRLAHRLIALGVGADVLVGIAVERSVEMVVGLLAILKAGGAYVPLDPEYPEERLRYMIEDSGVQLLLTQSHLQLPLAEGVQTLALDLEPGADDARNPNVVVAPENLAYVIYTSGSTGRPKGAGNRHSALVNRLCWMQQAYRLDARDSVLQKTPFSFDVSVWEFFWPLMTGARLVVAAPGDHRDPARLVELITGENITTLHFVPSMLQAFLQDSGVPRCTSLARIVCSGEALPADAQQQVFAKLPKAGLYNLYGPTEAAVDVSYWPASAQDRSRPVPIGFPVWNTRLYVLDARMQPVPVGVAGDLYLGGVQLARGYLGRDDLTTERFLADPFLPGERIYRTGDVARWRRDGAVEYLGRSDHQVKLRGLRIELGEIEAALRELPGMERVEVLLRQDAPGDARLVAYVPAAHADAVTLRSHLATRVPDYMVPSAFVGVDHWPVTANGKLDRRALPAADASLLQQAYVAPVTELEQQVAGIWAQVLELEQVGLSDNFFELGGHSLLATQVVLRLREALGHEVPVKTLFLARDLADFCEALQALQPALDPLHDVLAKSLEDLNRLTADDLEKLIS
ncbi:MAG TPA: non-ribosomal peptide synthetase, partial [Pseudomonas sp.]|nr:non-ribosomal peptide synthetase [Pseudomonas sp.]